MWRHLVAKFATNARGAMLLLNLIQVTESISGSVVPLAKIFLFNFDRVGFLLINYTSWPDYNESNDGQCGPVCALIGVKEEELPCNGPLLLSLMMPGRNLQNLILVPCHLPSPAGPHLFQQNSCNLWFAPQLFIFLFALTGGEI